MVQADEEGMASGQRYEPLARRALEAYELDVTGLTLIGYDWNFTFRVETADGETYALRVYLAQRRSDDEISVELAWLEALASESVVRVPRPIRSVAGSLFEWVHHAGVPEPRRVAVFTWVPGDPLGDDPEPFLVSSFGEGVARLHEHGRSFLRVDGLRRGDSQLPHGDAASLFAEQNADIVLPPERAVFERAMSATREALARLDASDEEPRIVHGDLHQENVFVYDEKVWFLDFDDCLVAWPVQDLGVTMWEVGEDEATWPYRDALRAGYERVATWPERWLGEIDVFAAGRGLLKVDDAVGKRASTSEAELLGSVHRHAEAIGWFLDRADDRRWKRRSVR